MEYGEVGPLGTRAERQQVYDEYLMVVNEIVVRSDQHATAVPDCPVHPLCIGGQQAHALHMMILSAPDNAFYVTLVALMELGRSRKREGAFASRLEIQRKLTNDAVEALASAHEREQQMQDEIDHLLGRIDELEHAIADETAGA